MANPLVPSADDIPATLSAGCEHILGLLGHPETSSRLSSVAARRHPAYASPKQGHRQRQRKSWVQTGDQREGLCQHIRMDWQDPVRILQVYFCHECAWAKASDYSCCVKQ